MYWPLAKASEERSLLTRRSGNDCIRTIDASGWTTHSQNVSQRISGSRLASAAEWDRAYSITIDRLSERVLRVGVEEPEPVAAGHLGGHLQGVGLAGPAGRQVGDRDHPDPRIGTGEVAGDRAGPVGAPVVDDQDLEVRILLAADRGQAVGQGRLLVLGRDDRRDQGRLAADRDGASRESGCRAGEPPTR